MLKHYSHKLKNDLEVIAIPMNRGSNVITSNIFYKVGSRNETMGKSGIAHMLEHMNFKSTKNLKEGEFDKIVKSLGGVDNASTGFDYTHYFIKTSSKYLSKTFELFSEVMQNLNLTEEEFSKERKVVYEERLWRTDNNPYGYLYFRLFNNLFLYHPYHWTPIGFKEDILNWSIEDIRDFHKTFYQPQNAFLLVAGDVDENDVFKEAEKYFENIKNSGEIPEVWTKEPPLDGNKEIEIIRETEVEIIALAFRVPKFDTKESLILNAFAEILASGESSLLRDRFIHKKRVVNEITAFNMELKDEGVFIVMAMVNPGVDSKKVIREIHKTLLNTKISKKLLEKVKNISKVDFLRAFETSSEVSDLYGDYIAKGNLEFLLKYEENLNSLKVEDFEEVKKYLEKGVFVTLKK